MLSQKINLEFERYANGQTDLGSAQSLYQTWNKAHFGLLQGDEELGINQVSDPTAQQYLEKITSNILFVESFLAAPSSTESSRLNLYENQQEFLKGMEVVVKRLELDSDEKLRFIAFMEIILAMLSATVLIMEVRYIYRPISQSLVNHIKKFKESQYKFEALFESTTDYNLILNKNLCIVAFNSVAQEMVRTVFGKDLAVGQSILNYSLDWVPGYALPGFGSGT